MKLWLALFLALASLVPSAGHAQQPLSPSERRTLAAVRMNDSESICLDGRLDEDIWARDSFSYNPSSDV